MNNKFIVALMALITLCMAPMCGFAATDSFAGVKFDSTASQNAELTKLKDDFRPVPNLLLFDSHFRHRNASEGSSCVFNKRSNRED